jgi:flavin-dependent dehydrogenase
VSGRAMTSTAGDYDVVIIGAGLAGLSLARQLLLNAPGIRILQIDKRGRIPPVGQKVGEATVQVSGYYFAKVLELEEYLLREHYMKYNLRFYWKTAGCDNTRFESYSQSYIRGMSNVPTYQLDRNKIEGELLRRNVEDPRYTFQLNAINLDVSIEPDGPHRVAFTAGGRRHEVTARWVVDAAGRAHVLQKKLGLERRNAIRHGASFMWVEGLLDIERLTDSTPTQIRLNPARQHIGHLPFWLATNHFCEEGLWFWTIPLQGITSLGLVYDTRVIRPEDVNAPDRLVAWVCEHFPLFARDLPARRILHYACYRDFSFDCEQTIDRGRWAMIGEAGRWTDPLYSPGGDLITIYNTLVTDAILTADQADLDEKTRMYEQLEQAVYKAYVPSFAVSYDCLGDQEAYSLKYIWELTIYFAFYVFPIVNDFFTDRRFVASFLQRFSRLGRVNLSLQAFITAFYHWKKAACEPHRQPMFVDFYETGGLGVAEKTFYKVGVSVEEARTILDEQLQNVFDVARQTVAHIYASVLDEPAVFYNRSFLESLDLERLAFDVDGMRRHYAPHAGCRERYDWPAGWNPEALVRLQTPRTTSAAAAQEAGA